MHVPLRLADYCSKKHIKKADLQVPTFIRQPTQHRQAFLTYVVRQRLASTACFVPKVTCRTTRRTSPLKTRNHEIPKSRNHEITKSRKHETTKSRNHEITKSRNHDVTKSRNHEITMSRNHETTKSRNHKTAESAHGLWLRGQCIRLVLIVGEQDIFVAQ